MEYPLNIDAYFISPEHTIIPVEARHIDAIVKHPRRFGLDYKLVKQAHNEYREALGSEASARSKLMSELIMNGWIRVRFYHGFYKKNRYELHFEVRNLGKKTRERIYDFLMKVSKGKIQSAEFIIRNPDVYIFTSEGVDKTKFLLSGALKDIVGKLHARSVRKLKVEILGTYDLLCGNPMALPDYSCIGYFNVRRKEYELRVYQESKKSNEFSFHLIPPDRSYEAVIDAKTLEIVEWKYHKPKSSGISKEIINGIKNFFREPKYENEPIINWEWFIATWDTENDRNPYGIKCDYNIKFRPKWWNQK